MTATHHELYQLYREYRGRVEFATLKETASFVPGSGPLDARVACVGEAPGREEDREGLPFVGASGQLLDRLLVHAGLLRPEVFVTNLVKWRPPGNRDPAPEEAEAGRELLVHELVLVGPRVVVTLGRHSWHQLGQRTDPIGAVHGERFDMELYSGRRGQLEVAVVPMYHPAAALRRKDLVSVMEADFARLGRLLRKRGMV